MVERGLTASWASIQVPKVEIPDLCLLMTGHNSVLVQHHQLFVKPIHLTWFPESTFQNPFIFCCRTNCLELAPHKLRDDSEESSFKQSPETLLFSQY